MAEATYAALRRSAYQPQIATIIKKDHKPFLCLLRGFERP